jgi:OmpA-OmpF porin, OOP family
MRKLAVFMALASTAMAGPAFAKDKAWYVGVEGGGMIVEDSTYDLGGSANAFQVNSKTGFDVDGIIGYDLGPVRIEGEVGYKRAENEGIQANTPIANGTTVPAGNYRSNRSGSTDVLSFMANGLLDFGSDDGINGYVGGGVGVARVSANIWRFNGGPVFIDDTDTRFAWQAIAGVRMPLTSHIDAGVKYRFFNTFGVRQTDSSGVDAIGRFRSHSLLASLVYNFGEPAAPPPPPPPPSHRVIAIARKRAPTWVLANRAGHAHQVRIEPVLCIQLPRTLVAREHRQRDELAAVVLRPAVGVVE